MSSGIPELICRGILYVLQNQYQIKESITFLLTETAAIGGMNSTPRWHRSWKRSLILRIVSGIELGALEGGDVGVSFPVSPRRATGVLRCAAGRILVLMCAITLV